MRFSMAPKSARAGANSLYGQMDLTGVISTLESHWVVLDAELSEIRKDFNSLKALTHKHGDFWSRPMAQLKKLRTQKENLLKEYAAAQPRVHAAARLRTRYSGSHSLPPLLCTHPHRIKFQMELFNLHIQQGRDLCAKLSSVASVIKTPPAQLQSQLAIEVVSPILANSQNPLSVAREPL